MNKKVLVAIVATALVAAGVATKYKFGDTSSAKVINLSTDVYLPYVDGKAPSAKSEGFEDKILSSITPCLEEKYQSKITYNVTTDSDPMSVIQKIKTGVVDLSMAGWAAKKDRYADVSFSYPLISDDTVIVSLEDNNLTIEELFKQGKKIGVQAGTFQSDIAQSVLNQLKLDNKLVVQFKDDKLLKESVKNKQVEFALLDYSVAKTEGFKVKQNPTNLARYDSPSVMYAKKDGELIKHINACLKETKEIQSFNFIPESYKSFDKDWGKEFSK